MMRALYCTEDLPPVGGKAAAFSPSPPPVVTNPPSSSMGLMRRWGHLNDAQPSPHPAATPDPSFDPHTVGSGCSPDLWAPVVYVTAPTRRPDCVPVPIRIRNNLPVPAGSWLRVVGPAMRGPKMTGRRQVPWPRAFQRFPSITRTGQSGTA